ncbi:DUF2778 domain-containing protein [Agrobacterium sp. Azo12]|uniref:DUF2778 domain-containing protein n=1 Tax=Agrobacterium sp. Azo12 TaxID=3031129 RepID=UPI0023D7F33C|nr:DUF2778 domain-containing protein [Agrobacterium sp. Azo12]MDO5896240.1 DUF2778 domain-containing protein [Agrobacterium sp. Azo12]
MATKVHTFGEPVSSGRKVRSSRKNKMISPVTIVSGVVITVAVWMGFTVSTMQSVHASLTPSHANKPQIAIAAHVPVSLPSGSHDVRINKFSRLGKPSEDQIRMASLTSEGIKAAHKRTELRLAKVKMDKALREATLLASAAPMKPSSSSLSALVEVKPDANASASRRFDLILNGSAPEAAPETAQDMPDSIPLPSFRPQIAKISPAAQPKTGTEAVEKEVAMLRPEKPTLPSVASRPSAMGARTAVYEIETATVHMPNGDKLEAHSGLGSMRDNPKYVHVKMKGSTPPSSYKLTMREALFHGVEALRLTPESGVNPHGRNGLLAHTYMLARRGESNGCVVFKEYPKFLAAFKRGDVNRIVVVSRLESKPVFADKDNKGTTKTLASLFSRKG